MSVIVTLSLPAEEFELGRALGMEGNTVTSLESIVPLGGESVPFFRIHGGRQSFEAATQDHPAVNDIRLVNTHNGEALYALDWNVSEDTFFRGIVETNGSLLEAKGTASEWSFDLRFRSHSALGAFQEHCVNNEIPMDVQRIYNPTKPDAGPWYGLSGPQRETLGRAVERGYYDIPRGCSTKDLAEDFDLSDQAVTERLRRGISSLVENTILIDDSWGVAGDVPKNE